MLDESDDHDHGVVVAALAQDLVAVDPGAALRARAAAEHDLTLHDPAAARAALFVTVQVLGLKLDVGPRAGFRTARVPGLADLVGGS